MLHSGGLTSKEVVELRKQGKKGESVHGVGRKTGALSDPAPRPRKGRGHVREREGRARLVLGTPARIRESRASCFHFLPAARESVGFYPICRTRGV
jgi:hypothetical protein